MNRLSPYLVLIAGILSPFAAAHFGLKVFVDLTGASADRGEDFVYRLSMAALAMAVPFAVTLVLALVVRRGRTWTKAEKVGLAIAALSLGLTWSPLSRAYERWQQERNLTLTAVAAAPFNTRDLNGETQRLADHAGRVVVVNVWATWCYPCRKEMPALDRLFQERKDKGLSVFGFSPEDEALQKSFIQQVLQVSYPLLTANGDVPAIYRNIVRYPATFLIDRKGQLRPAPGPEEPFEKLEAAVDALLAEQS
jgi:thiol-disulfide isomerase/thioredoxin